MTAATADHNDLNILRAAGDRHRMPVGEFRRADRDQTAVPDHGHLVVGIGVDVFPDHLLRITRFLQHLPVVGREADHQGTSRI